MKKEIVRNLFLKIFEKKNLDFILEIRQIKKFMYTRERKENPKILILALKVNIQLFFITSLHLFQYKIVPAGQGHILR